MSDEKRYKIMERVTMGWFLSDPTAQNLTKDECDRRLTEFVKGGANPKDLMAVIQDDPRYPNDPYS